MGESLGGLHELPEVVPSFRHMMDYRDARPAADHPKGWLGPRGYLWSQAYLWSNGNYDWYLGGGVLGGECHSSRKSRTGAAFPSALLGSASDADPGARLFPMRCP